MACSPVSPWRCRFYPKNYPVVLTVFLALGAWRIAQRHVLTRRMPAIETLGSATVLCVDKTGTLTENRMSVRTLYAQGVYYDLQAGAQQPLPEAFHELVELGVLASQQNPFDPMETGLARIRRALLRWNRASARRLDATARVPLIAKTAGSFPRLEAIFARSSLLDCHERLARSHHRSVPPG